MISQKELKKLVHYNKITGIFTNISDRSGGILVGSICGSKNKISKYIEMRINGSHYYGHRLAFLYVTGVMPKFVDHRDTIRSNNKWLNLRTSTRKENNRNSRKQSNNKSGYKGVSWSKKQGCWRATIVKNRKQFMLGYFNRPKVAHEAYKNAAIKLHGNFANFG